MLTGVSVLVVDDEADSRDVIAEILEDAGASVQTASSVDEALGWLDVATPNAIVSDIRMPLRDGYALIHELRTEPRHHAQDVPVIAITAFDRNTDRRRALTSGFASHVSKTDAADLATIVRDALRPIAASP